MGPASFARLSPGKGLNDDSSAVRFAGRAGAAAAGSGAGYATVARRAIRAGRQRRQAVVPAGVRPTEGTGASAHVGRAGRPHPAADRLGSRGLPATGGSRRADLVGGSLALLLRRRRSHAPDPDRLRPWACRVETRRERSTSPLKQRAGARGVGRRANSADPVARRSTFSP